MDTTILGRTGLRVSVMGMGCGGPSRAGQSTGRSEAESIAVIQMALDAGVNLIDTSEVYGTEAIVGRAIRGRDRTALVLSTKKSARAGTTRQDVEQSLQASLKRLGTDYVDLYHLHGVMAADYAYLCAEIVPELQRLRDRGLIRYIGITERFASDTAHAMLERALRDSVWDVMMVGLNLLNQSARWKVLPATIEERIGVLVMFAVRRALSRPERLAEVIAELVRRRQLDPAEWDGDDPLGFLVHDGGAVSLTDAAYRFCRYEPGAHVILSGTGNLAHLEANIASFGRPPLPDEDRRRLVHIFRRVDTVSGE